MRWVFLVVGFGAGLAVGLALRHEEPPRGARAQAPVVERLEPAPREEEPPHPAPREEAPPPAPDPGAPVVVEPTGDLPEDDVDSGYGRIEVDFEGFDGDHRAWVTRTTLSGSREEEYDTPRRGATIATFDVVAGVYDVWWLRGPRRVGTRARVVAGRVARLRAVDFDAACIPDDLAVLGISVGASWGGPLPFFQIHVDAADDRLDFRTNRHGCVSATLRPGPVAVKVGDHVTPVVLAKGRETVVEIAHRGEGDVLFEPPRAGGKAWLALRTPGKLAFPKRQRYMVRDRDGFLYLAAGTYEVVRTIGRRYAGGSVLGTVRVLAGRASVFRVELPPGVLEVRVEVTDEVLRRDKYVQVRLHSVGASGFTYVDQVTSGPAPREGKYVRQARIDGLQPGKYVVTCGNAQETVEVGSGVTRVVLRPLR